MREVELKDEENQVKRIISTLPHQQRQVIVMRDVNECSMEEIEQAIGLSPVNIRVLLSRTRKVSVSAITFFPSLSEFFPLTIKPEKV